MRGLPDYPLPSLFDLKTLSLNMAQTANPGCQVIGISVNTQNMNEAEAVDYLRQLEQEHALPATDPLRFGADKLVDVLVNC